MELSEQTVWLFLLKQPHYLGRCDGMLLHDGSCPTCSVHYGYVACVWAKTHCCGWSVCLRSQETETKNAALDATSAVAVAEPANTTGVGLVDYDCSDQAILLCGIHVTRACFCNG